MSFNKVIVVGNLGRDPELRYTPQGKAVANFSIASNSRKKDKQGEFQDITTWFRVTVWDKVAENAAKYLTKGSPVFVQGELTVDEWTDRDGNNRYNLELNAQDMKFLPGGNRSETALVETRSDAPDLRSADEIAMGVSPENAEANQVAPDGSVAAPTGTGGDPF